MPLTIADTGRPLYVQRIGGNEETKRFLGNLGFVQQAEVMVISRNNGNVIVNIKDTRVAVSESIARKIMVI